MSQYSEKKRLKAEEAKRRCARLNRPRQEFPSSCGDLTLAQHQKSPKGSNQLKPSEEIMRLCRRLKTVPMFIADPLTGTVNPAFVEQLLVRRHQYDDNLSIKENVRKNYGKECAELMERCI